MAANTAVSRPSVPNRRKRVRHKIQTPAYASFAKESKGSALDLHEIVDISEDGVAIHCHSPLDPAKPVDLCLDLADCPKQIYTSGHVTWSNNTGRAGIRFEDLPPDSLTRLREWLFVNVMAGVANSEIDLGVALTHAAPKPNFTDTLAAVSVVQHQVEALGADFGAALKLIAERAHSLTRASGAAVALPDTDPEFMVCRASSGDDAPPVGARLHVGSGFSGECIKTGVLLRCDDSETDVRVDRERCRALGIRSILAAPVRVGDKSIGLVEALSSQPNAFADGDGRVLQRLADTVLAAINRSARAENLPPLAPTPPPRFDAPQGSVLFAAADKVDDKGAQPDEKLMASLSLPRSHLFLLTCAFAAVSLALGFVSAPWIQSDVAPWVQSKLHNRHHAQLQTVLASSRPPKSEPVLLVETATLSQLQQMAENGDATAQNALGLRYATGDGVVLNEQEAVRWFIKAAEQGNVAAQSKLGSIYYSGRGVPQDPNRAYFWMVVARISGDDASKTLAPFVRARLTRAQVASIEQDASRWFQQHSTSVKAASSQLKSSL
jgi:TPR repeat protein